jgi:N-acetylmuramoyl-L-alanine amidase
MTKDGYISKLRRSDSGFCQRGIGTVLLLSMIASGNAEKVYAAARPGTAKSAWATKQAAAKAGMKPAVPAAAVAPNPPAQSASAANSANAADAGRVTSVRFWSLGDITRVAIEVSSPFTFTADHLSNPERVFFDIRGARPEVAHGARAIPVGDSLVNQIRIAETLPKVTRVVLDLARPVSMTTSQLANPYRLIVELHAKASAPNKAPEISRRGPVPAAVEPAAAESLQPPLPSMAALNGGASLTPGSLEKATQNSAEALAAAEARREAAIRELSKETPKADKALRAKPTAKTKPPETSPLKGPSKSDAKGVLPETAVPIDSDGKPDISKPISAQTTEPEFVASPKLAGLAKPTLPRPLAPELLPVTPSSSSSLPSSPTSVEFGEPSAARNLSPGDPSLTRVLGLKLGRIVLDPGHGGQDVGTHGPSGYLEKDLVLDVAHRLGALLEQRMGSEVVFTRGDDTFVPLEERTHLANQRKADLFLSIHANSSPVRSVAGVETYVLNFTPTRGSNELAVRENASSSSSLHDLKSLVEKIAAVDKANESREFATRVQTSLSAVSTHSVDAARNRGVKRAPFVVLIGASMPSVLAEIGFLTNGEEEALLRMPEHRQKIAEALYKGIASYAETLSRFDLARKAD